MSDLLIHSFLVSTVSESLRSLIKNERCERIAQVAHQKWAMWVNHSGRSCFAKNEQFAQKRDEQIPSPANTVPCSTYVIVAFTADFKDQQHATSFLRLCTLQGSSVRQRSTSPQNVQLFKPVLFSDWHNYLIPLDPFRWTIISFCWSFRINRTPQLQSNLCIFKNNFLEIHCGSLNNISDRVKISQIYFLKNVNFRRHISLTSKEVKLLLKIIQNCFLFLAVLNQFLEPTHYTVFN